MLWVTYSGQNQAVYNGVEAEIRAAHRSIWRRRQIAFFDSLNVTGMPAGVHRYLPPSLFIYTCVLDALQPSNPTQSSSLCLSSLLFQPIFTATARSHRRLAQIAI